MDIEELISLLLIALSLSADCFAVALGGCVSIKNLAYIKVFRTALTFGVAQAVMPVVGWLVGRTVIDLISGFDHWIAFGLLVVVGGRLIWEAFHDKGEVEKCLDITRGSLLFTLAFATSIDALAVGLSFAFLKVNIILASLIIGIVAFGITNLGFYLGSKTGNLLGQRAKIVGGIILIAIGLRILITHLMT
jgi:manganese efflux pump family protein